ncbi:BNR repeat-containing protein [Pedobacter metabolipauper]|nr:BNR repeat-containing protein [Pedobacter metabolipauper]
MSCLMALCFSAAGQGNPSVSTIANNGWSNNSINTVIFRKNALATHQKIQYAGYYDADQYVVLACRNINSDQWTVRRSQYKGDAADAHKSISIQVDGAGVLHVAWGQHNNPLNYARAIEPGSLVLGEKEYMLGERERELEQKVTYPEFYRLKNGDLLFFYRDGGSGNGNLMINRYVVRQHAWQRVQNNLIDGAGERNAYWQTAIDEKGTIHISWVWRERPDVASNHDLCYARSFDGGVSWEKSNGERYELPIRSGNAEYICRIPQNSELINQTSMFADKSGRTVIAGYWRDKDSNIPQYHVVYQEGSAWKVQNLNFRKTPFSLSGTGTKRIPISRPQIVTWKEKNAWCTALIFRDEERQNKVSVAINKNITINSWTFTDLNSDSLGEWEPAYDTELWKSKKRLDLFIQKVVQIDGEGKANNKPSDIQVLSWKPVSLK